VIIQYPLGGHMASIGKRGRLGAALIAGSLLLSGCENMSDSQKTQLQGAGGGAALGGIVGAIFGDAKGAAIGSALGAAVGYGVGSAVADRKQQYATAEKFYDAQIRQTQATNQQLARYNRDLGRQVAGYRQEIAKLQTQVRSGNAQYEEASRTHRRIEASYAESKKTLDQAEQELEVQKQVADEMKQSAGQYASRTQQENEQVAALASHVSVLQQQVETLASQSNQLQQFR
jgi:predicted RNase H-like nuclease (RuvC/YqgF family)